MLPQKLRLMVVQEVPVNGELEQLAGMCRNESLLQEHCYYFLRIRSLADKL